MKTRTVPKKVFVLAITILVCVVSILGGELDYAGNDDTFRNLISVGAFGDLYTYYIPFSNVIYGLPIAIMNAVIPGVNWYYWIMILLSCLSIAALCNIIFDSQGYVVTMIGTSVICITLSRDYFVAIQFTKVASLCVVCGIVILYASIHKGDHNWIWGMILFAIGAACRMDCAYMAVPFACLLAFFSLLHCRDRWSSEWFTFLLKKCIWFLIVVVILLGTETVFRNLNTEWDSYWDYNRTSAYLLDQKGADYNHNPEKYDFINTDNNDLALFMSWEFGDTDFYTIDWIKEVIAIEAAQNEDGLKITPTILMETCKNIIQAHYRAQGYSTLVIVLTALISLIVLIKGNSLAKIYVICNLACFYAIYWYFTCINRFMWRAELGAYIAIIAFSCCYYHFYVDLGKEQPIVGRKIVVALGVVGILVVLLYSGKQVYNWRYVKDKHIVASEADITGKLYEFRENPENFYVLTDFYVTNNPMSITKKKYNAIYENSVYLGNWIIPSPNGMHFARIRDISNPMRALLDKHVYLYSVREDYPEMIRSHLEKVTEKKVMMNYISEGMWEYSINE